MSIVWVLEPHDGRWDPNVSPELGWCRLGGGWWHLMGFVVFVLEGGRDGWHFWGENGGKRVIFWVLEPQRDRGWEMGPQCVTRVGVVASYGVGGILWGWWSSCCRI